MRGLQLNGRGYVVVRMNSTSGRWIVERTTENQICQSQADIHSTWTRRSEAESQVRSLNAAADVEEASGVSND